MVLSVLQLAFSLPSVPGRQGRRLGRYLCEMEDVLAFELACCPHVCLIGDGLWARGVRREGKVCEGLLGVEWKQCKAACPRVVANGVTHRRYALRNFGEIS